MGGRKLVSRALMVVCWRRAGGAAAILVWGAKGSKDAKLPITVGPLAAPVVGPRGRV